MKVRRLSLATLLLALVLSACGDDGGGGATATVNPIPTTEVAVVDNDFEPAAIAVDAGATVIWTWAGSNQHDVSGDGLASKIQTSGFFEHTFDKPGELAYRCTLHSGMRGRVVVA